MLPGTAQIWIEALSHGRSWDQGRDASRIRGAFLTLAQTRTQWPGPLHFLQALPDSTQLRLTGAGERPADPPELVEALRSIKPEERVMSIADAVRALGRPAEVVTPEQRAEAEREIEQRRQRDGKALAAGTDA